MTKADTLQAQSDRVQAARDAGHVPIEVLELGWGRDRCLTCGTDWPCPDMAEAREWRE